MCFFILGHPVPSRPQRLTLNSISIHPGPSHFPDNFIFLQLIPHLTQGYLLVVAHHSVRCLSASTSMPQRPNFLHAAADTGFKGGGGGSNPPQPLPNWKLVWGLGLPPSPPLPLLQLEKMKKCKKIKKNFEKKKSYQKKKSEIFKK